MRDWVKGGNGNDWNSFGFWSNGNPYNIPEGIYYSFPIATESGASKIVNVGHLTDFQKNRMNKSAD
jgi:malate/lactate dehydrogenase